ncbi:hypothetical protein N7537_002943 [Penicillium hordei]|uniref:Uncharacterized protein n=1 Tax=Penicillium hordei TaxID=40994 RepID=A0AAD6EJH1_9EURO|nr:uncharacterized protein N7537_002943 [Penicillium hordei]KAJ5617829.1 hypothetical protein N7537_002943 [Penicillium hordei]
MSPLDDEPEDDPYKHVTEDSVNIPLEMIFSVCRFIKEIHAASLLVINQLRTIWVGLSLVSALCPDKHFSA